MKANEDAAARAEAEEYIAERRWQRKLEAERHQTQPIKQNIGATRETIQAAPRVPSMNSTHSSDQARQHRVLALAKKLARIKFDRLYPPPVTTNAEPTVGDQRSFYEVIGVSPTATTQEIERACFALGEKVRPDKTPLSRLGQFQFAVIERAYETLTDPEKRARYDQALRARTSTSSDTSAKRADAVTPPAEPVAGPVAQADVITRPTEPAAGPVAQTASTHGVVIEGSSNVKGWVYVISNKAMPGLVKVGFSMKDPELRARELDHTGVAHPYVVDYEMLVDQPFGVEQRVHRDLATKREGREWFRCTAEEAISAIKYVVDGKYHAETFKRAERDQANQMAEERRQTEKVKQDLANHVKAMAEEQADKVAAVIARINREHEWEMARQFPKIKFLPYWLGWGSLLLIAFYLIFEPVKNDLGTWVAAAIAGAIVAAIHASYVTEKRKKSSAYTALIFRRDKAIQEAEESIRRAGSVDDADAAYRRGDYATALRLWRPLADRGDALAQFNVGTMYAEGQGVPQDYVEAMKWYRLAADQRLAWAQGNLGAMYALGYGVAQNYAEAIKWYQLAADQGVAEAQFCLGFSYYSGQGVAQDYVEALKWFNLANARGDKNAGELINIIERNMTSEQIAEAQRRAAA